MKAVFASDGTKRTGNIIISYLIRDGGINYYNHKGDDPAGFYYIDKFNIINCVNEKRLILNGDYQIYDLPAVKGYTPPYPLYGNMVKKTDVFIKDVHENKINIYGLKSIKDVLAWAVPGEWVEAEWTPVF